ncbi:MULTISPECIES: GNAT family N-acetyltransferase [unclassified Enterococcus]|uniref:GNAT family N-acetyltransferase n=1 Tax=unclassified Enterococcus TaxID=2608891 RepID=UPI001555E91A|nr:MULTISPECIES: GNAT family N-acetyltransferase [unclassified Enterococcus]MBS7577763.1 GNAT family N-acetyltransferase [Enterococcus sp. MMGLQ5-2]MBS7585023.1 GNAT family N-acetyltransferase [Enterococcus sp. MMGLQ5-1]NPD12879.1 GNAT family N-acetyltransferase [Enterococcus sp. MMGLQ5-1]NPD37593.1 GNAT family N-acetyltransferase [Enterococcus sp. MMGLQ5-2]
MKSEVKIRVGSEEDIEQLINLVMLVIEDMDLPLLKEIGEAKTRAMLIESSKNSGDRYSFRRAIVATVNEKIAGVLFGYPSEEEATIDKTFNEISPMPLFNSKETYGNEWYIDTLVTSPNYRGQGVARRLIQSVPNFASIEQKDVVGLNVDINNIAAKNLYKSCGFVKVSETVIGSHHYDHMYWKY